MKTGMLKAEPSIGEIQEAYVHILGHLFISLFKE